MDVVEKSKSISIHPFVDQDFEKLVELSVSTYPGKEISNPDYLNWEYNDNPDGKAIISVAEEGGEIVSQYLVLPRKYLIGKEILQGSLSANTLTKPGFRGQGLFTELANATFNRCREEDIQFTIGFPNQKSHPIIRKHKIFQTIGHLHLFIKLLNPTRSIARYVSSPKKKSGEEIDLKINEEELLRNGVSLFDFSVDGDKYERFLKLFNGEKENITYRSLQYLKWRYSDIPFRNYFLLKVEMDNQIMAIAVFRARYIYGMRCGILVDLISLSNEATTVNLLNFINEIGAENNFDLIVTTVPVQTHECKILKGNGYISVPEYLLPQKLSLIVQSHSQTCPADVTDFKKWYLTFGDYDIF